MQGNNRWISKSVKPNSLGKCRPSIMDKAMDSPGLEGGAKFKCKPLTVLGAKQKKKQQKTAYKKDVQKYKNVCMPHRGLLFFEQVYYRKLSPCSEFGVIFLNKTSFIPSTFGVALVSHTWVPAEPCWWWPTSPSLQRECSTAGNPDASSVCGRYEPRIPNQNLFTWRQS